MKNTENPLQSELLQILVEKSTKDQNYCLLKRLQNKMAVSLKGLWKGDVYDRNAEIAHAVSFRIAPQDERGSSYEGKGNYGSARVQIDFKADVTQGTFSAKLLILGGGSPIEMKGQIHCGSPAVLEGSIQQPSGFVVRLYRCSANRGEIETPMHGSGALEISTGEAFVRVKQAHARETVCLLFLGELLAVLNDQSLRYYEMEYTYDGVSSSSPVIGICPLNTSCQGYNPGAVAGSIGYNGGDGFVYVSGKASSKIESRWTTRDRVGVGFDGKTKTIFFTKNGERLNHTWQVNGSFKFCVGLLSHLAEVKIYTKEEYQQWHPRPDPVPVQPDELRLNVLRCCCNICDECDRLTLLKCRDHDHFLSMQSQDGVGMCPDDDCPNLSTLDHTCESCHKEVNSTVIRVTETEIKFIERDLMLSMEEQDEFVCLVCPMCTVLEFAVAPGVPGQPSRALRTSKLGSIAARAALGAVLGMNSLDPIEANRRQFKHYPGCRGRPIRHDFRLTKPNFRSASHTYQRTKNVLLGNNPSPARDNPQNVDTLNELFKQFFGVNNDDNAIPLVRSESDVQCLIESNNHRMVLFCIVQQFAEAPNEFCQLKRRAKTGVEYRQLSAKNVQFFPQAVQVETTPMYVLYFQGEQVCATSSIDVVKSIMEYRTPLIFPVQRLPRPNILPLNRIDAEYVHVQQSFSDNICGLYQNLQYKITSIRKIVNPQFVEKLNERQKLLSRSSKTWGRSQSILTAYHGTHPNNVQSIAERNLAAEHIGKTDNGWHGRGFYFSFAPDYALAYNTHGRGVRPPKDTDHCTVLQFDVLLGNSFQMDKLEPGTPQRYGFHSHISRAGYEYVLFDECHFAPRYIIDLDVRESHASKAGMTGKAWEGDTN